MVEFKNDIIKVRCLECRESQSIKVNHVGTEKEQRTMGFEYEHEFTGEINCDKCGENLKLLITVYEYPKGIVNYIDIADENCVVTDEINNESFYVIEDDHTKIKVLTPEEITLEIEKRKSLRRQRLEKKVVELTKHCDRDDVIYVFSYLINKLIK